VHLLPHRSPAAPVPAPVSLRLSALRSEDLVAGRNMSRFHRLGCVMVQGKDTSLVTDPHLRLSLRPCEICLPEESR